MPLCNATSEVQGTWGCPEIVDHEGVWILALTGGIAPVDVALIGRNRDQKTVDAAGARRIFEEIEPTRGRSAIAERNLVCFDVHDLPLARRQRQAVRESTHLDSASEDAPYRDLVVEGLGEERMGKAKQRGVGQQKDDDREQSFEFEHVEKVKMLRDEPSPTRFAARALPDWAKRG